MAKVVTSQGLVDFVQSGNPTETIADKQPKVDKQAPPLEVIGAKAPDIGSEANKTAEPPPKTGDGAEDTGLEPEDHDLAERAKKRIGKKHYEMKVAQEAAAKAKAEAEESDRFAENLFNERESWKKKAEEAERKAADLEKRLAPAVPELKEPDENDPKYKDANGQFKLKDYIADTTSYAAKKAVEDDRKAQSEARAKAEADAAAAAFKTRIDAAVKKNADWLKVVQESPVILQNECLQYIAQSEYGTDLAYHLAKNPAVAEKIKAMHPIRAIAELGKLETSFEKPANAPPEKTNGAADPATSKTVEPKGAPPPITPISTGTGTVNVDPAKMSFKELRAYERERRKR